MAFFNIFGATAIFSDIHRSDNLPDIRKMLEKSVKRSDRTSVCIILKTTDNKPLKFQNVFALGGLRCLQTAMEQAGGDCLKTDKKCSDVMDRNPCLAILTVLKS